jgi:hypothetical protein
MRDKCCKQQGRNTKDEKTKYEGRKQEEGAKELNHSFAPSYFKDLMFSPLPID